MFHQHYPCSFTFHQLAGVAFNNYIITGSVLHTAQLTTVTATAPVLLADYVTTGNEQKNGIHSGL